MEDEKIERLRERILQCPICIDEYKDPRILPCHHTVCLNCLLDYVRHSSSSGRLFRCPQCRSDICVPRGGVKDFPPNFYVNCIQDELGSRPYFGICDICERDWLISQYRCVDCDLDICRFCIHEHKLFKHGAGREVTIMRIETGNIASFMASEKGCEVHSGETLQMFCCTCETAVCVTCVCEVHKKHETMPLVKKLMASQKELQFDLDDLKAEVKSTQDSITELRQLRTNIHESSESTMSSIRQRAREIAMEMDKVADEKVERIRTTTGTVLQEIDGYLKELEGLNDQAKKGCGFLEDLQEDDVSLELFASFTKYKKGLEVVRKSVQNKLIITQTPVFEPGKLKQYFGFHLFRFGDLQFRKQKALFLKQDMNSRFSRSSKSQKLCCLMRKLFYVIFFALVASGLMILTNDIRTSDHVCLAQWIGWLFFLHLAVTAANFDGGHHAGTVTSNLITEASGICASRTHQDVLYTHNDSGDTHRIFAISATSGARLATIYINGAHSQDWEDIACGPCTGGSGHCVYIGDTGGNAGGDANTIYRIREPSSINDQSVNVDGVLEFSWDQHDCETLLVDPKGEVYVVSKVGPGHHGKFVHLPASAWNQHHHVWVNDGVYLPITASSNSPVGGDISPSGTELLLKTYGHVYYWSIPDMNYEAHIHTYPQSLPYHAERQGEAVCWKADGSGFYTLSEGANSVLFFHRRLN